MSQITLRICGIEKGEYKIYQEKILNSSDKSDFLIKNIKKEVKLQKKKKLKEYRDICLKTLTTLGLIFVASPKIIFAEETSVVSEELSAMPSEIIQIGLVIIGLCATVSTILAIILAQIAGGYRMLRKKDIATGWTTDIIKGYTQVLLAPVIIIIIAFITFILFKDFEWFITPF